MKKLIQNKQKVVALRSGIVCHRMLGKLKAYTGSRQDRTCSQKRNPWTISKHIERTSGLGIAWQHMAARWQKHWERRPGFKTPVWVSFKHG